jgi:argininosuccinate lyase
MDKDMELLKGFPVLDIEKQPEKLAKFKKKTDKCYQELKMRLHQGFFAQLQRAMPTGSAKIVKNYIDSLTLDISRLTILAELLNEKATARTRRTRTLFPEMYGQKRI